MFDYVKVELPCPQCGSTVKGFQTKDNECMLSTLLPSEVKNFYSSCDKCKAWISCEYVPPKGTGTIIVTSTKGGEARCKDTQFTVEVPYTPPLVRRNADGEIDND